MTKTELKEKWNAVLELLYAGMERIKVDNFFLPLTPVKLSDKKEILYLKTPGSNASVYQTIINNNAAPLTDACVKVFGKAYKFEIVEIDPTTKRTKSIRIPFPKSGLTVSIRAIPSKTSCRDRITSWLRLPALPSRTRDTSKNITLFSCTADPD